MSDRDTVTEIIVEATPRIDVPLERDCVLGIDRFEAVDGPYRVERW
ncbi:hypothetical protein RBH26_12480 [Natronolimnohabitans sp. A-GB9]|nr:hypothetical protein [Natronolimnohabitans sp. A-GB9]MDQ2051296.1 hypothetical protein [Natronolimnohabitans sp. A-GB9]